MCQLVAGCSKLVSYMYWLLAIDIQGVAKKLDYFYDQTAVETG